jgi:hypothetical protein
LLTTSLGQAELGERLAAAEREVDRLRSSQPTALGAATDAMHLAWGEAGIGVWRLRLGMTDAGRAALRGAEARFLAWLDLLEGDERARQISFGSGSWLALYRHAVVFGHADVERRLGEVGTDPRDGGMITIARPWVATALALARGDDTALADALVGLRTVPDEKALKDKWWPGLGATVDAILRGDAASVGPGLGALFRRHGELIKRGSLHEGGLETREPSVLLALARRRGLDPVIDAADRTIQIRQKVLYVKEWEGRPVGPSDFQVEIDLSDTNAPWQVLDTGAKGGRTATTAPARTKSKLPSELPEAVVREALAAMAQGPGPVWQRASAALAIGEVVAGRQLLVSEIGAAKHRAEHERLESGHRNINKILDYLSLAVAVGTPADVADAAASLRRLALESPKIFGPSRYSMALGYLVLIADVLDGLPPDRDAALALLPQVRRASIGLIERDERELSAGIDDVLRDHVVLIDRQYPEGPPVSVRAVHFAAAARRLGIPFSVDPRYRAFPVPIVVTTVPGERKIGHVPCDLLGEALWTAETAKR